MAAWPHARAIQTARARLSPGEIALRPLQKHLANHTSSGHHAIPYYLCIRAHSRMRRSGCFPLQDCVTLPVDPTKCAAKQQPERDQMCICSYTNLIQEFIQNKTRIISQSLVAGPCPNSCWPPPSPAPRRPLRSPPHLAQTATTGLVSSTWTRAQAEEIPARAG